MCECACVYRCLCYRMPQHFVMVQIKFVFILKYNTGKLKQQMCCNSIGEIDCVKWSGIESTNAGVSVLLPLSVSFSRWVNNKRLNLLLWSDMDLWVMETHFTLCSKEPGLQSLCVQYEIARTKQQRMSKLKNNLWCLLLIYTNKVQNQVGRSLFSIATKTYKPSLLAEGLL